MADLTTAPATSSQVTTQNPQAVPSGGTISGASKQSGGVQPGTAPAVLTSQDGLSLHASTLTAVSLDTTTSTQAQAQAAPAPQKTHHMNTALIAISIALVLIAIVLFWAIGRSAKNTTE